MNIDQEYTACAAACNKPYLPLIQHHDHASPIIGTRPTGDVQKVRSMKIGEIETEKCGK
jgi:hypothetical protein